MDIQIFENSFIQLPSPLEEFHHPLFDEKQLRVFVKRDDLIHPIVTGNKWRKLKDYLLIAQSQRAKGIISFGGAYSNHIYSLAYVCNQLNFGLDIIIRGEELNEDSNDYLKQISNWGAKLHFVSRTNYRNKIIPSYLNQEEKLIIPEGGFSEIGVDSVSELADELMNFQFDELFLSVGTGTTLIGLAKFLNKIKINGILSLSNEEEIRRHMMEMNVSEEFVKLWPDFISKKYGKKNTELEEFCIQFNENYLFKIEPIYTGLLVKSLLELISKNYFKPNSKIVLIHSGGIK